MASSGLWPRRRCCVVVVVGGDRLIFIHQNYVRGALQIVELTGSDTPEKREGDEHNEDQCERYK